MGKQITIDEDKLKEYMEKISAFEELKKLIREATVTKIGGTNAISFAYDKCFKIGLKNRPAVGQKIKIIEPD